MNDSQTAMPNQDQSAANDLLEDAYRPPLWVSLVFVVTMLIVYLLGRSIADFYDRAYVPSPVESVG